ncbi:unnamed protein product [Urochloa humidicola]
MCCCGEDLLPCSQIKRTSYAAATVRPAEAAGSAQHMRVVEGGGEGGQAVQALMAGAARQAAQAPAASRAQRGQSGNQAELPFFFLP